MVPVAPALLSTRKDCLNFSVSSGATARATWSVEPPGGNGTTIVTALSGQVWADAPKATAARAAVINNFFMLSPECLEEKNTTTVALPKRRWAVDWGAMDVSMDSPWEK